MYSGLTVSADRTGQPRKSLDFQDRSQLFPTAMALASVPVVSNYACATETVHKINLPSSSTLPQDTTDKEDAVFRVRIPCQGMPAMSRHTWSLPDCNCRRIARPQAQVSSAPAHAFFQRNELWQDGEVANKNIGGGADQSAIGLTQIRVMSMIRALSTCLVPCGLSCFCSNMLHEHPPLHSRRSKTRSKCCSRRL